MDQSIGSSTTRSLPFEQTQKPKVLFLDFDDTLLPSTLIYSQVLGALGFEGQRLELYLESRKAVKRLLNRANSETHRATTGVSVGGEHPSSRNRLLYFKKLIEIEKQSPMNASRVLTLMESYETHLSQQFSKHWKRLKRDLLFESLSKKIPCFILTNENTRTQLIKLAAIDPDSQYFSGMITSEEIGVEKPDPLFFQYTKQFAEQFIKTDLNWGEILMCGDSYESDIKPARALGMRTVHSTEFLKPSATHAELAAHATFSNLEEIIQWI